MTTKRVLIVDDSLTVRMDLSEAFESSGFEPLLASTLADARDLMLRESVDLIVLDVLLPDGDGIALLAELRARPETAAVPIVMLSTEAEVRDRIRGLSSGADEYVGKPYDAGDVAARAWALLRRSGADAPQGAGLVLIIDDSPTFSEGLAERLRGTGYAVACASSGEDGLRMAGQLRPAVLIVDGNLPGIDGPTVIARLRLDAALHATPCILLTGSEDHADEVGALDAGADAYLCKGTGTDEVLARLTALVRADGGPRSVAPEGTLFGPKRVMAVDDSMTFLNELSDQLRQDGYDVVVASSGQEALDLLAVQSVDCVLLDLMMPGLSGMDTCRQIKSVPAGHRVPVIILTGHDDQQSMLSSIEAGADDYVPKGADYAVLRARLRAQLRRQQYEAEHRGIHEALIRKELEAAEARAAQEVAETRAALAVALSRKNAELKQKNRALEQANHELDAFTYSVSHDLRAPLRSIDGFAKLLLKEYGDSLDEDGRDFLSRICRASAEMAKLIAALLELSRLARASLGKEAIDIIPMVRSILDDLRAAEPERSIEARLPAALVVNGDPRLLRVLLTNLIGNAWKFTSHRQPAIIEVGGVERDGEVECFVRDNGAGFDMAHAHNLFGAFQRLHSQSEFEGTGIGLATARRIVHRHGGAIWAQARPEQGASFFFTFPRGLGKEDQPS